MMLTISILLNFVIILIFYRKKIRKFLLKSSITNISLSEVDQIFELNPINEILKGPKDNVIIKSFCINSDNPIVGMTSDYEGWILAVLSKNSNKIFEFGTCSGKTTYLMALNSPENAKIFSLTLNQEMTKNITKEKVDNKISFRNIINESIYEKFLFSGSNVEKKINVIFENSLNFNQKDLLLRRSFCNFNCYFRKSGG